MHCRLTSVLDGMFRRERQLPEQSRALGLFPQLSEYCWHGGSGMQGEADGGDGIRAPDSKEGLKAVQKT